MDLLLTHGFFLNEDPKELRIMKPYPPLGILYISSHLRARGFDVEIYDSTFGTRDELNTILQKGPPSILGIGANLLTRRSAIELLPVARDAGWKVVLGGPEPPSYAEEYLACGADVIVQGEAEITMEELIPAMQAGQDLSAIPGIIFRAADGTIVRTPQRPLIKDLDRQPWPDRERIAMDKYLSTWREHHGTGSVSLITARGCPYSCTWCSHSTFGRTHRRRSVISVVDEIAWIRERYSPEMLWIADDVFTIDHGWLAQFSAEMKARGLRIPFECITRADRVNPRVAETLAALGCFRVWIGSESGSQKILDAMKRGVTVQQVQDAVALCRNHGIQTGMFLMWGYEGETLADIEATVRHVKACRPDVFLTTVSYPIKGTAYHKEVAGRLVQLGDWARSSDREIRISGRHSRHFYEYADQWLKAEVAMNGPAIESARLGLEQTFQEVDV
jgi:anaerobic magnesium-protoporphyrin IX monomethyl ester cyclase